MELLWSSLMFVMKNPYPQIMVVWRNVLKLYVGTAFKHILDFFIEQREPLSMCNVCFKYIINSSTSNNFYGV